MTSMTAICLVAFRKIALLPGNREFWAGDRARVCRFLPNLPVFQFVALCRKK
jgi:hypothetical protein